MVNMIVFNIALKIGLKTILQEQLLRKIEDIGNKIDLINKYVDSLDLFIESSPVLNKEQFDIFFRQYHNEITRLNDIKTQTIRQLEILSKNQ